MYIMEPENVRGEKQHLAQKGSKWLLLGYVELKFAKFHIFQYSGTKGARRMEQRHATGATLRFHRCSLVGHFTRNCKLRTVRFLERLGSSA